MKLFGTFLNSTKIIFYHVQVCFNGETIPLKKVGQASSLLPCTRINSVKKNILALLPCFLIKILVMNSKYDEY
jgi:hypothetical protein